MPDTGWDATLADWLAGLFAAPLSDASVGNYRVGLGAALLEALEQEPGCGQGAITMQTALAGADTTAAVTRRLGAAFTQLFEGAGGPHTVSPYESAHVSPSGRLFQAADADMGKLLRRARLVSQAGDRAPVDHVSVELAFLSRLMRQGGATGEQLALLDEHLLVWAPGFAAAVELHDRSGFYAGAASVLAGFLAARRSALIATQSIATQSIATQSIATQRTLPVGRERG